MRHFSLTNRCRVMILKTAPTIVYRNLKELVGSPEDYYKNKGKGSFPDYDTRIPIKQSSEEDDIEDALRDMKLSDWSDEEQKV